MKKIITNKLFSMLLAITLLLACTSTFTTNKPTKANADEYTTSIIRSFVIQSLDDLTIVPDDSEHHICFIVDKTFFTVENYTITTTTTIDDLNNSTFMQTLAMVLTDTVDAPPLEEFLNEDGLYDCGAVFNDVQMDLLIYRTTRSYLNITNNEVVGILDYIDLLTETNTGYNSIVYGLIHTTTAGSLYELLNSVRRNHDAFYSTSYYAINVNYNPNNLYFITHNQLL